MQAGYRAPKKAIWSADAVRLSGRQNGRDRDSQDPRRLCGVAGPTHAGKLDAREPGDPGAARRPEKAAGRRGNPQGHALHVRRREVGLPRSTCERSEQGRPLRGEPAEEPEGRRRIRENAINEHTDRITITASRGLQGVREAAQKDKGLRFTTLLHHVNEKLLLDSFLQLKKQAAPGVQSSSPSSS
jgi:hypothetical protein